MRGKGITYDTGFVLHGANSRKRFDPELVANPLAPENLLKSSGRGIFLIKNFMA